MPAHHSSNQAHQGAAHIIEDARPSTLVDPIVGIDLGTTNSLVAYCDESGPRILGGGRDGVMLPSVVRYRADVA